ncbi:MAG TPA: hypothetical protein H9674_07210 [Firmicutes bacterium]|nr:hypothetical protein [Bacillota bacterium]
MKKGIKAAAAGVIVLCAAAVFIAGYIRVNRAYPPAEVENVPVGETAVLRGIEISPQNFELLTAEQINEAAPGYLETQSVRGEDIRLLLVAVHLKNTSQEEKRADVVSFSAQGRAWRNGLNLDLFYHFNEDPNTTLEPGEEKTLILPFEVLRMHFWERDWQQIDEWPFEVVINLYPTLQKLTME